MNGNKIINVGSPMKDSDVATKKYVDNRAKITLRGEGYGDAYHYDDGSKTVSMPLGKWDFCFLIGFVRSGRGDNLHKIKFSSCKLTEYLRIWTLITKSDNKGHTRCGARCVKLGGIVPVTPTGLSAYLSSVNMGKTFNYQVRACNTKGCSPLSPFVTINN